MKISNPFGIITLLGSATSGIFGTWGIYTEAGHHAYDGMAGIIPFFALCMSFTLFVISFLLFVRTKINNTNSFIFSIVLGTFGYWGFYTNTGRLIFGEGNVRTFLFAAMCISPILMCISLIFALDKGNAKSR